MTRASRSTKARLLDILSSIDRIEVAEGRLQFAEEAADKAAIRVAVDAILYNLVVIGEAVNALPEEVLAAAPHVPWREVVGMRNFLAHEYFKVLTVVVRKTINAPLAQLRNACEELLD